MRTKRYYNVTACKLESAVIQRCPRCKGDGSRQGEECDTCKGHGRLWITPGSCLLPLYSRAKESRELY